MNQWLRTDESQESMVSLEMVCEQLSRVRDDPHSWKWVIVALHNALQGYMVMALQGSNYLNIFNKDGSKKWLAYYSQKTGDYPELYVDSFLNLYKKIKNSGLMSRYVHSRPFKPTGTQTESVMILKELRNDFIHYFPGSLSLEVSGFPKMVQDCIDIIAFLAFESRNILWHDEDLEVRTGNLIETIRSHLDTVREEYEK